MSTITFKFEFPPGRDGYTQEIELADIQGMMFILEDIPIITPDGAWWMPQLFKYDIQNHVVVVECVVWRREAG